MDFASLPKVVLHDHLDGGLRPATIVELAAEYGYSELPTTDVDALEQWFDQGLSGSLERYLEAFDHTVGVMQHPEAVERVAYESLIDAASDGVVHLESRFAPSLLTTGAMDRLDALAAAAAGFRRAESETGTSWGLLVDAMRQEADSAEVAEVAIAAEDLGVVGFDLAGPEAGFPASRHRRACETVLEAGLGLTIHAGEASGPGSILDALDCGAQRIGHGFRIIEDCTVTDGEIVDLGPVAKRVHEGGIPLEICPISNTHTTGMPVVDHPIDLLRRAGFVVTVSPDNRLMSRTTTSGEYRLLATTFGWGEGEFDDIGRAAAEAIFGTHSLRTGVRERLAGRPRSANLE